MADLRFVSINLWWRQTNARAVADINDVQGQSDILCVQETYNVGVKGALGSGWSFHQGDGPGNQDNAVAWRRSRAHLVDAGYHHIATLDNVRHKTFKIAWVKLLIDGEKKLVVGSTHPPHGGYTKYDSGLYARCMDGTVEWWRKHADWGNVVIGGDWNKPIVGDPGNLSARLPGVWSSAENARIDGFFRHRNIDRTRHYSEGLNSDHPAVYMHINPATIRKNRTPDVPPKPDDPPVGKTTVRIGTYNILWETTAGQTKNDLDDVILSKVDILGMQEVYVDGAKIRDYVENRGWEYYRPDVAGAENAIIWRKGKWDVLEKHNLRISPNQRDHRRKKPKQVTYVLLKHKDTNARLWVIDAHVQTPGHPWSDEVRRVQFGEIRDLYNKLNTNRTTVILVGDMNTSKPFSGGLGPGLASATENKRIDHIVYKPSETDLIEYDLTTATLSSDHPFHWGTYKISGGNNDGQEPDRPTTPDPEEPAPPNQPHEPDEGHNEDIDHDDCCGGTEEP
jgi:exonuclease III